MHAGNRAAIEQRIEKLRAAHGAAFGPDVVIDDARDKKSPLHTEFEWDRDAAAMEHWRDTARHIIHVVTIVQKTKAQTLAVPAYVRNPDAKARDQGYVSTAELRSDRDRAWAALQYAVEQADSMIRRAQRVAIAVGLEEEVEFVASALAEVKQKIKKSA